MDGIKQKLNKISASEARQYFGRVIQRAYIGSEHLVVEKNGLPVVVILPISDYEEMRKTIALQNLQELNKALNRKANVLGLTEEELASKVEETKKEIFEELYG